MRAGRSVVVALVLLAAACGGGGGDEATGGSTAGTGSPAQTTAAPGAPEATAGGGVDAPGEAAPLPPAPEPAPALPCDGSAVLCVDASGGADHTSVTDAVAAADDGTVIQVAAGDYAEPVLLEGVTDLRLVGGFPAGGDFSSRDPVANETILRGDQEHAVVAIVTSTGVHVEGFHLTGGGGFDDGYVVEGGGVYVDRESIDVAIVANRIDGNEIDHGGNPPEARGGGISASGTDVRIVANVIEANRGGRGAGIAAVGPSTVIDRNTVVDNYGVGDHGGGLWLAGELTVTANHVEGNIIGVDIGYGWGGGMIVFGEGTVATLRGNVVTGNLAPSYGSGVFIDDGASATLLGELYYANQCSSEGGTGFFVDSGGPTATTAALDHVTIATHDCPESSQGGDAIYSGRSEPADPMPVVTVTNSILWGNAGRDVLVYDSEVSVTSTLSEEGVDGEGNVSDDPLFVDPASGDFTLADGSPAAGAGSDGSDLGYTGAAS